MSLRSCLFLSVFLLQAFPAIASMEEYPKVLRAYGPGGPHHVLQECAELFREQSGVSVAVIKASPAELVQKVPEDGDIYFGGAEYMLETFASENPGVLDLSSAEELHPRRIGVVVRKGNPLNIKGVNCLHRDDVDVLAVHLENMEQFHPPRAGQTSSVRHRVYTGQDGVAAWQAKPELDAWVTYRSWHVRLEGETEFIDIPGEHAVRHTPAALTNRTPHREKAQEFLDFLKSAEAREIFVEHGWD